MSYPNKILVTDIDSDPAQDFGVYEDLGVWNDKPDYHGSDPHGIIRWGSFTSRWIRSVNYDGTTTTWNGPENGDLYGTYTAAHNSTGSVEVGEYTEEYTETNGDKKMADEMLLNKTMDMDGAVHEWTHPYVRYVDIARERVRNKDGTWGPASGAGAVSWVNSAHDLELEDAAFAASEDSDLGVWLWNIPDNMPNKVLAIVYDAETAADTNPPVGFCYIFKNKRVVSGRGAPLSVFGEVVK